MSVNDYCVFCGKDLSENGKLMCDHCEKELTSPYSRLKQILKEIIREAITELREERTDKDSQSYTDVSEELEAFYRGGQKEKKIRQALEQIKQDEYYDIIPLYYNEHFTLDYIAERFGFSMSTIARNKKRLCLELNEIINGNRV